MEYADLSYRVADLLPREEDWNLKSQLRRAATSVALNIAEGSTGQSDPEQARFLGHAIRSLLETVACLHLIRRRGYVSDGGLLADVYDRADSLARKLQALRRAITPGQAPIREASVEYTPDG